MSTIGILPTTPTPFPSTAAPDPGEFLDLSFPFPDEDPLGLTTLSSNTNTFSWNGEPNRSPPGLQAEFNWADQRPINAQLRNGQPTPPEDRDFHLINTTTGDNNTTTTATTAAPRPKQKPRKSQSGGGKTRREKSGKTRREKSLERNRVAASKCRQKKKEHTAHLESRLKAQWQKKTQLESELSSLRCQILSLKNEVLKHAHCGDGRVGEHLSQMMQQITTHHPAVPEAGPEQASENENEKHAHVHAHAPAEGVSPPPHLAPPPLAMDLEEAMPELLEEEMRRESQASLSSDASYALSMEENFDDLINV